MSLSVRANELKRQMMAVVTDKRECEAIEKECLEWIDLCDGDSADDGVAEELFRCRLFARRRLAESQLHNVALLQRVQLTPLQRQLMRLRYVKGQTWTTIIDTVGKSKQYLLREHNKALEKLAKVTER